MYKCPICHQALIKGLHSFNCINQHNFDISKHGYVNLLKRNSKHQGDDSTLVKSRIAFLKQDYYLSLKQHLNTLLAQHKPQVLVDLACGSGYYTKDVPSTITIGIDLSKDAIQYACKQDKKNQYIIASIFDVPLMDHCADVITTIFAPSANEEIIRLLKQDGLYIRVDPGSHHLLQLKETLYEEVFLNPIKQIQHQRLTLKNTIEVKETITLNQEDLLHLFNMTPYRYKTKVENIKKLQALNTLEVTIHFMIYIYQKN